MRSGAVAIRNKQFMALPPPGSLVVLLPLAICEHFVSIYMYIYVEELIRYWMSWCKFRYKTRKKRVFSAYASRTNETRILKKIYSLTTLKRYLHKDVINTRKGNHTRKIWLWYFPYTKENLQKQSLLLPFCFLYGLRGKWNTQRFNATKTYDVPTTELGLPF